MPSGDILLQTGRACAGAAAAELSEAAGRASECTRRCGNLGAAWKLLGDAHLALGRTGAADPIQTPSGAPSGPAAGAPKHAPKRRVAALIAGWHARIWSVQKAQRAYAVVLHLAPWEAGTWGDAAVAFGMEAQLRRAHANFMPQAATGLRSQAERLLRGRPTPL